MIHHNLSLSYRSCNVTPKYCRKQNLHFSLILLNLFDIQEVVTKKYVFNNFIWFIADDNFCVITFWMHQTFFITVFWWHKVNFLCQMNFPCVSIISLPYHLSIAWLFQCIFRLVIFQHHYSYIWCICHQTHFQSFLVCKSFGLCCYWSYCFTFLFQKSSWFSYEKSFLLLYIIRHVINQPIIPIIPNVSC